ncbi:MAG: PepSY domain-containing protein [Gammaproteobacteria bacterium]|nr:PepSY domain-containing protein [Gammaproteobacteria bacterium]
MSWAVWHKWHRLVGIGAALFVILLAISGMLLNHTQELGLHEIHVQNETLLNWYDIGSKSPITGYQVDGNWIAQVGERLFFNRELFDERTEALHGAVAFDGMIVIAVKDRLFLVSRQGEMIEKLGGAEGVPAGMKNIGVSVDNQLVISAAHGVYIVDIDSPAWQEFDDVEAQWSVAATLPETLRAELLQSYRGTGLPLERVILDLHSGRMLGPLAVYFMDFIALLFIFLALSGGWMWLRHMWR